MAAKKVFVVEDLYEKSHVSATNEEVNNLYKAIIAQIKQEHTNGGTHTKYDLPSTFTISMFEKNELQMVIYGSVIEKLEQGGFYVTYTPVQDAGYLYIKWKSLLSESEISRYKNIIAKHIKK